MIAESTAGNAKTTSDARMTISSKMPFHAAAAQPIATPIAAPEQDGRPGDGERVPGSDHQERSDVAAEMIGAEKPHFERCPQTQGDADPRRDLGRP